MLHRGIKFVHAAVLAFSAVLAFLFIRALDADWVLGNSALVWVIDSDDSVGGAQVSHAVASFAADHGVTVAREAPDLKDPDGRRHLYLAPGGHQSVAGNWLDGGYPAFGRDFATDVHPIAELGQRDPRGYYYVFGSSTAANALVAEFATLGLQAKVHHPLSFEELAPFYAGGILALSFLVVALAATTMTAASVLLNAKAYAVLRLQGKSFAEVFIRDLRQLAVPWVITATVVVAGAATFLAFYNGLAWLSLFVSVAAGLAGLLVLLILVTHATSLALTFKVEVLRALKGELPARIASLSAYLVRVPALLLALGIAMDVALAGQDISARQDSLAAYSKIGEAVTIRLNGSMRGEEDQVISQVGPWLRQADAEGKLVVAGRRNLQDIAPNSHLPQAEVLVVNETFLSQQPLLDPTGQRYGVEHPNVNPSRLRSVRLIVPESLKRYASGIAAAAPHALGILDPALGRNLHVKTDLAMNGQRIFSYNAGKQYNGNPDSPGKDQSLVRDPVILVVPNGSKLLTDDTYTALASQESVVFPDPDDVLNAIATNNSLQTYVVAVRPVGQNAALKLRDAVNDFRLRLFDLVVAVAVLLITGIGVCIVYSRKNAQIVFAKHISGWRFVVTHRSILAVEGLLAILLATRIPYQVWEQNQELNEFAAAGIPAPYPRAELTTLALGVTAGLVAIEVCAVLLTLALFHRRIIKEGATES